MHQVEKTFYNSRSLRMYETDLGFDARILGGQIVLNFGSGNAYLERELNKRKISATVIEMDLLKPDDIPPVYTALQSIKETHLFYSSASWLLKHFGVHGRKFIKGDGRHIPFGNGQFTTCLAEWSTYQVPNKDKVVVYKELLRISDRLHIAPIWGKDFDALQQAIDAKKEHEIVLCQPWEVRKKIQMRNVEEYNSSRTVVRPKIEAPRVVLKGSLVLPDGSCIAVIKRK